ncbi:cobyrinate a,c-diamide synthase [Lentilactobacillus raoultii]|uniref:Cobyrinate a,c-diamide synthase n=1 Tax=Lentilactobacillus raoultii TaxID=1987503 RepID=A0ABW3PDB7_9LACO|nr:cobyrinate a,c-diamide synthase [Lentilactobacillus raoultii]
MKKILIAGVTSGSGKTTVTLGILSALSKQVNIQPYKVGPDYVDTKFHSRITGRKSRNIDSFLVPSDSVLRYLFSKETERIDLGIIEGAMGLYDGLGTDKDAYSTSSIAKKLQTPVILVVNGKSASTSIAAIVKGMVEFDSQVEIVGVIINNVMSLGHYQLIKGAIDRYVHLPVLGYLPYKKEISLPSRQLGLVPDDELPKVDQQISEIGELVKEHIDLGTIMKLAVTDQPAKKVYFKVPHIRLKLGIALDNAFNFYYQDNLKLLEEAGVALSYFSPIHDDHLPNVDALYIGGGYPEEFAKSLSKNLAMKSEVKKFSKSQKSIYAECGGLMYLGKALITDHHRYSMVNCFDGDSKMTPRLKKFGYCSAVSTRDTILGSHNTRIVGHEFHHSIFLPNDDKLQPVLSLTKVRDGKVVDRWQGGYQIRQTFASYLHVNFYQDQNFFKRFLEKLGAQDNATD